jgi:hypothetical protein
MSNHKIKPIAWLVALAVIMACVPTISAPTVPTIDPGAVNTFIAQTAVAAINQTAAALPSSTPTATFTSTPRNTDTPEPTPTNTIVFILPSSTPVIPTASGGGSGSRRYACQLISMSPPNGTVYKSREDFDAKWSVKNIGQRAWEKDSTDYLYLSGDKLHKVSGYDISKTVKIGDATDIIVDMVAPKQPGTYTTNWTLAIGSELFCTLSLTITVK